jgi:hypothetical protein
MAEQLTPEHFRPYLNKVFRVRGGRHALTLSTVETQGHVAQAPGSVRRDPFNLIFTGPPGDLLREGLYMLDVEDGPHFELYVMPVHTPARDRQNYQAAFN